MRKLLVLGAGGTGLPPIPEQTFNGVAQPVTGLTNAALIGDTNSTWVRFWADWPLLQPTSATPIGTGSAVGVLAGLESQVAAAQAAGLGVILTATRFPAWSNTSTRSSYADPQYRAKPGGVKDDVYCFPDDLTPTGPWARWIKWLLEHFAYANRPGGHVHWVEIVNEPNGEMWPQRNTANQHYAYCPVSQMMQSADAAWNAIAVPALQKPWLMGPATADTLIDNYAFCPYGPFMDDLLNSLNGSAFPKNPVYWIWTHHNYLDMWRDLGTSPASAFTGDPNEYPMVNRAWASRSKLINQWGGFPSGSRSDPKLFITEGGVLRTTISANWPSVPNTEADHDAKHADLMSRMWTRMTATSQGAGIEMVAQYLMRSALTFDSGLLDISAGTTRSAPYNTWKGFPGTL